MCRTLCWFLLALTSLIGPLGEKLQLLVMVWELLMLLWQSTWSGSSGPGRGFGVRESWGLILGSLLTNSTSQATSLGLSILIYKTGKAVSFIKHSLSCGVLRINEMLYLPSTVPAGGEGDDRGWDGWMASPTRWMWVWVNSGSWWWTGRPGMLQFMG